MGRICGSRTCSSATRSICQAPGSHGSTYPASTCSRRPTTPDTIRKSARSATALAPMSITCRVSIKAAIRRSVSSRSASTRHSEDHPMNRFALCAVAALLVGCGNMKESPNGFLTPNQFFQNDQEIHAGLAGAWEPLIDYNLYKQPSWIGESFEDPYLNPENWLGGSGTYNGVTEGNWYTERPWTGDYQLISGADQILASIPKCTGCTKANSKLYAGQAYFLRAWAYFDLAMRFGPAVIRNTPYTFTPTGGAVARSPLPVLYQQISADLHQAIDSLPTSNYSESIGGSRPSAISAWGLLAKVYLFEAGHQFDDENVADTTGYHPNTTYMDSAAYAAQQVISSGVPSLEPNY